MCRSKTKNHRGYMSIRCPVWSDPDSLAVNPALALPAGHAVGHGLTPERKWGLSLIFRQENRGSPHFLGFFFRFSRESRLFRDYSPPSLMRCPHPFLAKQKRRTSETAPLLHRCTSEAHPRHMRSTSEIKRNYPKFMRSAAVHPPIVASYVSYISYVSYVSYVSYLSCLSCRTAASTHMARTFPPGRKPSLHPCRFMVLV